MQRVANKQRGSAHALIIVLIVVALIGALGWVYYSNFIAKKDSAAVEPSNPSANEPKPSPKANTITEVAGTDMMRYTNYELGFQFDFPKQIKGNVGCHVSKEWYDATFSHLVDPPVTSYAADNGAADMTVLASTNRFTIAQKRAPLFTTATYGSDKRHYFANCEMVDVSQKLIDETIEANGKSLGTEWCAWQVYKLTTEDEIVSKAALLDGTPGELITSTKYTLGRLENGRQEVTYTFTTKERMHGGSGRVTWYYPEKKLLVHIAQGQSVIFAKLNESGGYYGTQTGSFKVLD